MAEDVLPLFQPSLATLLVEAEDQKGCPLTEAEVLQIRDKGVCTMIPREFVLRWGGADIGRQNCWGEWQRVRAGRAGASSLLDSLQTACDVEDFGSCLQQLELAYVRALPAERELLRRLLQWDRQLSARLQEQMQRVVEQTARAGDCLANLRARLLRISITDRCGSSLVYGEWIEAAVRGIDPAPDFDEIAAASSSHLPQVPLPISIQAAIRHVAADLGRFWPPDLAAVSELVEAVRSGQSQRVGPAIPGNFSADVVERLEQSATRSAAAAALCVLGRNARAAVPALCELLCDLSRKKDADRGLAFLAQSALCLIGAEAVPALQQLLAASEPSVRNVALSTLGRMGMTASLALPAIIERLDDSDTFVRIAALYALGDMGPGASAAAAKIAGMADDLDQSVCCAALRTLSNMGTEARVAVPAILRAIQDEDYLIHVHALLALKQVDPESAERAMP